ncbi:MAG TPA: FAD:protein FMN transferase [Dissulfurispiraceae bacterium]|nr:FAD:protein FMN transferase [Dissulfurispiraceae bacterium]
MIVSSKVAGRRIVTFVVLFFIAIALLISCSSSTGRIYKETRPSMYTIVSITVVAANEADAQAVINASFNELDRLARLLNFYSEESEVSEINRMAGLKPVKVSQETMDIIEKSVYISEKTDGAFDITVGPLVRLWDLKNKVIPDQKAIDEKMKIVGYRNIFIDRHASTVFIKPKGAQIDLGGIIKGYAVDKVVALLRHSGIRSAVVSVGGEVRTFGRKPDGASWVVGVQNPRQKGRDDEVIATVDLSDRALSTSGDYIRFFESNGVRYHHLLDPKTGYPSRQCGSATVVADDNTTADGFTKLFVLGPARGVAIAKQLGFDILFIDCSGGMTMSDGLKGRITLVGKAGPR